MRRSLACLGWFPVVAMLVACTVVDSSWAAGRQHTERQCIPVRFRPPPALDGSNTTITTVYTIGQEGDPWFERTTETDHSNFVALRDGTKHRLLMGSTHVVMSEYSVTNSYASYLQREIISFANRTLIFAQLYTFATNSLPLTHNFTAIVWCPEHGFSQLTERRFLRIKRLFGLPDPAGRSATGSKSNLITNSGNQEAEGDLP